MRGVFITFEGNEGSGKSLQTKLLAEYLQGLGYKVFITREPGNTKIGKVIRKLLLDPGNRTMTITAELFLYLADRAQHVSEVIVPYLKKGHIVLCDRFMDATAAYQGYGRGLPVSLINKLNKLAAGNIMPDITILLDVSVRLGLHRAKKKSIHGGDRMERQKLDFHNRVYSGYKILARKYPGRIKVITVEDNKKDTARKIQEIIHKKLLCR